MVSQSQGSRSAQNAVKEQEMTAFVIVDPYDCSVRRYQLADLAAAKQIAQLTQVDHGAVWGPFAGKPGCAIVVYEFGLIEPPEQHRFFAIGGKLYAGRAVLHGFDHQGRMLDLPEQVDYKHLNPIWLDTEREVERAIGSKLIARPCTKVNNQIIWEWPSK
jgi:hypothetical protein